MNAVTPSWHDILDLARRYRGRGCDLEDLEQTACVALVRAVHRYFRDFGWMVRPPRSVQELRVRDAMNAQGCFRPSSLDTPLFAPSSTPLGDLLVEAEDPGFVAAEARIVLGPAGPRSGRLAPGVGPRAGTPGTAADD